MLDTYPHVLCIISIRVLLAVVTIYDLHTHKLDDKTIFFNGDLEGEIYLDPPRGFINPNKKMHKPVKSLYDLKQASKHMHEIF